MKSRAEIKNYAKTLIHENYWTQVGVFVIFGLIISAAGAISFGLGTLILSGPLTVGFSWFFLQVYRNQNPDFGDMFNRGFNNFGRNVGGYLWMELFIFLWSLLFVIPGIIKSFSYALTPYILADCPNVKAQDALKLSMRMMNGRKMDLFVFALSFIGWALLSGLTFGLLMFFYVGPYMSTSMSGFYDEVKRISLETGIVTEAELS